MAHFDLDKVKREVESLEVQNKKLKLGRRKWRKALDELKAEFEAHKIELDVAKAELKTELESTRVEVEATKAELEALGSSKLEAQREFYDLLDTRMVKMVQYGMEGTMNQLRETESLPVDVPPPIISLARVSKGIREEDMADFTVRAAPHRITVGDQNLIRYAAILFSVPQDDYVIQAPAELVDNAHPSLFNPYKYGDFLGFLLTEEGVKAEDKLTPYRRVAAAASEAPPPSSHAAASGVPSSSNRLLPLHADATAPPLPLPAEATSLTSSLSHPTVPRRYYACFLLSHQQLCRHRSSPLLTPATPSSPAKRSHSGLVLPLSFISLCTLATSRGSGSSRRQCHFTALGEQPLVAGVAIGIPGRDPT
ncbi:hypothetical protein ZIOFF_007236 [Zingiber officinale]|uniref:Uncharacterized protein n=1 Tax=Zingiber officinale TaxID=94328 RepID=A0A8J5LSV3_ZINOF|nr:hypothetical protein ZIOFF_007236 [Zingiber officinale]